MEKQKISNFQAIVLISNTITPTAVLIIPGIAIGAASQDAWLSAVMTLLCGLLFALLYGSISRHNPGKPFLTYIEERLGRVVGVITGIILVQYYLGTSAVILREFVDFLSSELMQKTPITVLAVISMLVVLYAASEGIEVIARISSIIFVLSMAFLTLGVGLQINNLQYKFLFPVGEASLSQLVQGGLTASGWMSEASILLLISPYLLKRAHARKIGLLGATVAGSYLLMIVLLVLLIFGPELPKLMTYPSFATAEIIKYGNFVERIDIMFIAVWISTIYIKLCVFFFGTIHCFVHLFRIRYEKPFRLAIGVLVLLTALYSWPNRSIFIRDQAFSLSPYLLTANVLFPLALWMALQWRNRTSTGAEG